MIVENTMNSYLEALSEQKWSAVELFFHEAATVVFAEGTYFGKSQVEQAMGKTFSLIRDENFKVSEINWNFQKESCASCTFAYQWSGTLSGQRFSNKGRGTMLWAKETDRWMIVNKHLGPSPR